MSLGGGDGVTGLVSSGAVAAGDITDAGATGIALVQAATAAAADAVIRPWTVISLASSSGWTDGSGAGTTATIDTASQEVDLEYPVAAGNGLNAYQHHAAYWTLGAIEVRARLRTMTGPAHVDHRAGIYLSGAWPGAADYSAVEIALDGTARVRSSAGDGAWIAVANLLAGQGWVRVVRDGGTVRGYVGTGSGGAPPTTWTYLGAVTTSGVCTAAAVGYIAPLLGSAGARASDVLASWGDLAWRELP